MTSDTVPSATQHPQPRPASPRQLDWLRGEVAAWTREGLLAPGQAESLLGRYDASRRHSVGRLLLVLGAGFVGVGVIWLVAANLDQLGPLGRFLLVAAAWLGLLVGSEVLAARSAARTTASRVLVMSLRTLASVVLGAVVFQAAQSLQVPAWQPALLGWWALGALVQAYGVRSVGPLLVGLVTGLTWLLWVVVEDAPSGLGVVLALLAAATVAAGLSALHTRFATEFADAWREAGALLVLVGLFAAALPFVTADGFAWDRWLVGAVAAAVLTVGAGAAVARGRDRLEPLAALGLAAAALLLVAWDTGADVDVLTTGDWLHAVVSVAVYVVVAVAVAVLGTLRDSRTLTATATTALVVFVTFQSFAVFARIIEGAWLFVVLGLVFLGTGVLFDRTRRRLAAVIASSEDQS
ncbi:DUF2157 domain-containing protein [Nocardioides sp. GXQ0305]|uniref:DUF2157 domain-containing protein n=1 Tax=Nocardioides sp. GXQ0305 TaxID=3423912 RepID=UPI003D7DFF94